MSKAFSLPFIKKEQVAVDTWSYFFDKSSVAYDFLPGQYNRVSLPVSATDGLGNSRMFTIASSPEEKYLMVTSRRGVSDFKNALFALTPGTPVQFFGPLGGFTILQNDLTHHVLLAGGIGITPFHSMLVFASQKKLKTPLTLLASSPTVEEMVFYHELMDLQSQNKQITTVYTVTRSEGLLWQGEKGRISKEMIKKYVGDISKPVYMVSGSPAFVEGMVTKLHEELKIEEEYIRVDQFTGY